MDWRVQDGILACPPLVQGHVHLCQTLFRGMAESRRLLPWLERRIWPLEASHDAETMAVSTIMGLAELFSSGSCSLLDMGSVRHSDVIAGILSESGAHALLGNALMDIGPSFIARPLHWLQEETERVRGLCRGGTVYAFTPRFVLSCSRELWAWLAAEDPLIVRSTHSSEAPGEMEDGRIRAAGGNVRLLRDLGFLGRRTVLTHCVHLLPGELGILAETGTAVAHCPWANLKLGSGMADVPAMLRQGVTVMTGSDGAACNNSLDAAGDVRLAMGIASVKGDPGLVTGDKWFSMAAEGAADFLGFDTEEDRVEIRLSSREEDELHTCEDPWRYILELDWRHRVRKLVSGGRVVYQDGEFPTLPALPISVKKARERVLSGMSRLA